MPWCDICNGEHTEFDLDALLDDFFERRVRVAPAPESSRVRGLRAMANQDTSPHERDIARAKLKDLGLWP